MLSNDVPGRMSQTHDLEGLQRRVQPESSACRTSALLTNFLVSGKKARVLSLRHLRHGCVAFSIPAALISGTIIPPATPKVTIAPVAATYAVQSSLSAFHGDVTVTADAVANEFDFTAASLTLGAPSNTQYAPVSADVANLRSGPGTSYERVAKLRQGQTVRLLARSGRDWYKVEAKDGTTGWLHAEVVDVNRKVADQLTIITARTESPSKVRIGTTTDSKVNLRGGPSTNEKVLAELPEGLKLELIGQQDGWFKVATPNGTVGWVADTFVKVAPSAAAAPAAAKTNGPIVARIGDNRVNLRKGPDTEFGSFGRMAAGTEVQVLARSGEWLKVRSPRGTIGWVATDLMNVPVDVSAIPVTKDVPSLPKVVEVRRVQNVTAAAPSRAVSASTAAPSADAASIALQFVGVRYVYGGASPRGFDCSGLTSYVYKQLGVSLPHKASLQFSTRYGPRVGMNELAPGDLLFFANTAGRGITHVSIYVGNGMMVTANTPRTGVQYLSIYSRYWQSHYAGAIRPYR